jgi:hypothetical protein
MKNGPIGNSSRQKNPHPVGAYLLPGLNFLGSCAGCCRCVAATILYDPASFQGRQRAAHAYVIIEEYLSPTDLVNTGGPHARLWTIGLDYGCAEMGGLDTLAEVPVDDALRGKRVSVV